MNHWLKIKHPEKIVYPNNFQSSTPKRRAQINVRPYKMKNLAHMVF